MLCDRGLTDIDIHLKHWKNMVYFPDIIYFQMMHIVFFQPSNHKEY